MQEQMTVDSLLGLLNAISEAGHGSLPIFIGEKYPLLNSALMIDHHRDKLIIRNNYYDEKMAEALSKARSDLGKIYYTYLSDCLKAGEMEEIMTGSKEDGCL